MCQGKIFEVAYQALRTRCGDDAVEKQFCSDYVSCFGADIPKVFNLVAAHSPADAVWVGFFRPVSTDYV